MKINCWLNQNRLLSHLRTSFCALVIVGASLTLPSAEADRPQPASGGFFPCFIYTSVQYLPPGSGPDNFRTATVTFHVTADVTGTLTGHLEGTELDVVHHSDGSINLQGTAVFEGSINGRSGMLLFTYNGIGNAGTGQETLHFVARQGTGDLAGVHVEGTAEGDVGAPNPGCDLSATGTYTGQIVFAR